MSHAWMPASPCGDHCIDETDVKVSVVEALSRAARIVATSATFPVACTLMPKRWRDGVQRSYARAFVKAMGVELTIIDLRAQDDGNYAPDGKGVLVVAPHIGWVDTMVLAAVQPVSFVAKSEMTEWPVAGHFARLIKVVPIKRENLRALPATVKAVAQRLSEGERIVAFPEGTTWCGRASGGLKPAMFQAAIDAQVPVQPVQLRYVEHGSTSTVPAFIGSDSLLVSIRRLFLATGLKAEVTLMPQELPGTDRRDLAERCELSVHGFTEVDFDEHGVLDDAQRVPAAPARAWSPGELVGAGSWA